MTVTCHEGFGPMTVAQPRPIEETYASVQKLIYKVAGDFHRRFGGDFDDLVGEANVAFMKVYEAFDPSRGAFTTLLQHSIVNRLYDVAAMKRRRPAVRLEAVAAESGIPVADWVAAPAETWDELAYQELSEDARTVLKIVVGAPAELRALAKAKGGHAKNWRHALKGYLADMGWTANQVAKSFEEIAGLLQCG